MISECPHCHQALRFSDAHRQKLTTAINRLPPDRTLKFACPKCKKPIEIQSDGFPVSVKESASGAPILPSPSPRVPVTPPNPQDIGWLANGKLKEDQVINTIPTAMVLMPEGPIKQTITNALEEQTYQLYFPDTVDEAINSMRFRDFAVVVYHSKYETSPLNAQDFHRFMMQLNMSKRRSIYYILMGPEFQTLFDLEALTFSANLVVNTSEAEYLSVLLKKGRVDYEALFTPYSTLLKKYGKS
ncbi:hypothetical protein [Desulfobacula sp.]|uniref:hypothetical protein n=1 Tax=Desulfobacula sp. TaxID=2593537 RepID=UPI00262E2CE0|nr:hypothetical protein [Desulfobacula sp.]